MGYVKTYRLHRIFKDENGKFYCFDRISRKSKKMDTEKELRDRIDNGTLEFDLVFSASMPSKYSAIGSSFISTASYLSQL